MNAREVAYMPLAEIVAAPRNPKRHDHTGIQASIDEHGLAELPLLDERTGRLVAGHGRIDRLAVMHAAGQDPPDGVNVDPASGAWLVPVIRGWSSRSDAAAEAYVIASNKLTMNTNPHRQILGGQVDTGLPVHVQVTEVAGRVLAGNHGHHLHTVAGQLAA